MVEALEADPALRDRFQFWTFGYSTGGPIPYSALLPRHNLDAARRKFDPDRTDAAFERTVVDPHDYSKELRAWGGRVAAVNGRAPRIGSPFQEV
jgi:hypothetical protein